MGMKKLIIGGEFFYSPTIWGSKRIFSLSDYLVGSFPEKHYSFSFGGYYSILQILKTIQIQPHEFVLLPSYLCPTILIPFKKCNVRYQFYRVNKNLQIDIEDLKKKLAGNAKAIFCINYFGFADSQETRNFLGSLKKQGMIIIEDCVQSFFSKIPTIGDFCFNSFRKFLPLDGSVILSDKKDAPIKQKSYPPYFFYKLMGQIIRYFHVVHHIFPTALFLHLFNVAEKSYYSTTSFSFNGYNRFILSRSDIDRLKKQRSRNFKVLLDTFSSIALFKTIPETVIPLGFPILIDGRDNVREKLAQRNIFCPIHWHLSEDIDRHAFKESWYLSEHVLTIPIAESVGDKGLNYLTETLHDMKLMSPLPA